MTLEHIRFLKTRMGLGADASDIMTILNLAEERLLLEQLCERREGLEIFPPAGEDHPDDFWVVESEDLETETGAKTLGEAIRKAAGVSDD